MGNIFVRKSPIIGIQKMILVLLLIIFSNSFAENYRKVKLIINNKSEIVELQKLGIPLDDSYQNRDGSIELFLNNNEFLAIQKSNVQYNVLIDDWQKYYSDRNKDIENSAIQKVNAKYPVNGFTLGSMGGNYTLEEIWQKVDEMIANYPNLISVKDSIGASVENRPIYAIKISDNPNTNETEPEVLYTALIHAREPESMMQMFYFMYYLLENYGTNAEVTYLVDNREMYFIPVINPDGYYYNQNNYPNGGGMWRKNRKRNADGTYGVDLNRNYGFKWGYDNIGSSQYTTNETYRGTAAFSEPETETIRQYCINHDFQLALNYHTYSNLLITPWGYIPEATPDSTFFAEIASDMTQFNNYQWGYSEAVIYSVNGDSDDWFYGEQTEKNKIFAMTPEIGNSSDGFWPSIDRIIPLAVENVYPNLYLAWVAGGFVNTLNFTLDKEYYSSNDSGNIDITLKNKGLGDIDNISVAISISYNAKLLSSNNLNLGNIPARSELFMENMVEFKVDDLARVGDSVFVHVEYFSADLLLSKDTYSFIVGIPKMYFVDSLNSLNNWNYNSNVANNWELTTNSFYSANSSVTDSKTGDYFSNSQLSLISKSKIDLSGITNPFLKFMTKYSIESGWDYAQISVSTDLVSWTVVGGDNSKFGSGNFQPSDELIYDGTQSTWISEVINLNQFMDKQIYLKFELNTDEYAEEDGWFIDDISILGYANEVVSVNDNLELPAKYSLLQNYPNPFNPSTEINFSIAKTNVVKLVVYNSIGQQVAELLNSEMNAGKYGVKFDADNLPSGVYFYRLQSGDFNQTKKMILLK